MVCKRDAAIARFRGFKSLGSGDASQLLPSSQFEKSCLAIGSHGSIINFHLLENIFVFPPVGSKGNRYHHCFFFPQGLKKPHGVQKSFAAASRTKPVGEPETPEQLKAAGWLLLVSLWRNQPTTGIKVPNKLVNPIVTPRRKRSWGVDPPFLPASRHFRHEEPSVLRRGLCTIGLLLRRRRSSRQDMRGLPPKRFCYSLLKLLDFELLGLDRLFLAD